MYLNLLTKRIRVDLQNLGEEVHNCQQSVVITCKKIIIRQDHTFDKNYY